MTLKETNAIPLKPGYWWWNVAQLGDKPDWIQVVEPGGVDNKLFGYDVDTFMARQYKRS